jgi:hypothetical protein
MMLQPDCSVELFFDNVTNASFECYVMLLIIEMKLSEISATEYRFLLCYYWNLYHWGVGYATITISIVNIFKGFEALEVSAADRYDNWKHAYTGIIAALGGIAVLLEAYTWIIVIKGKKSENKLQGMNGTNGNGYGSRV